MQERLSFYVRRDSPLHRFNPLTKLCLAFAFTLVSFLSPWYWTPHFIVLLGIIPLSFLGRVYREYFSTAIRLILPATVFLFVMQALFQPVGKAILFQFWFLHVTRESLAFAFANASRIFAMVSSFMLFLLTTHPSELMSDLTRRGLPSQFAYVIISTIQIIPQMRSKAQTIIAAQRSRGLDTEGGFLEAGRGARAACRASGIRLPRRGGGAGHRHRGARLHVDACENVVTRDPGWRIR